jgi:uncharacterized protein RhaS with RHS repeats
VRGETPRPVDDHADGQPDLGTVDDGLDRSVSHVQGLGEKTVHTEVCVRRATALCSIERRIGQLAERQRQKFRVDMSI